MASDMVLLMRGLAKLSQAVVETQTNALRNGTGTFSGLNLFVIMTMSFFYYKHSIHYKPV